jgi:hypothetical protein
VTKSIILLSKKTFFFFSLRRCISVPLSHLNNIFGPHNFRCGTDHAVYSYEPTCSTDPGAHDIYIRPEAAKKWWSNEPGVDELDAGLHPRPGPVVGDGAHDGTQPKRPLKQEQG